MIEENVIPVPEDTEIHLTTPTSLFCVEEGQLTFVWLDTPMEELARRDYKVLVTDFQKRQLTFTQTRQIYLELHAIFSEQPQVFQD